MRKLSIEEKARRYDEVFSAAKEWYNNPNSSSIGKSYLYAVLPELKESKDSEDERIRNEIVAFIEQAIHRGGGTSIPQEQEDRWIAWLEAQGEHANFRNAIQVGDKVTRNKDGVLVNLSQLNRVAKKQGEQKPWSEEDEKIYQSIMDDTVQENQLDDKQTDWLKNLKDRVLPQQTEWSEDDKGNLLDVKCVIDEVWHNQYVRETIDYSCEELESLWHWLDNIWQRVEFPHDTWKPSDEQIKALETVLYTNMSRNDERYSVLSEFVAELKKLREE